MDSYTDAFVVSAPAGICVFGEHQAHLSVGAVALAVDMRVTLRADTVDAQELRIDLPGGRQVAMPLDAEDAPPGPGIEGVLRGTMAIVRQRGIRLERGYRFGLESDTPGRGDLGEECAMATAMVVGLLRAANQLEATSGSHIGQIVHEAMAMLRDDGLSRVHACACSLGGKHYVEAERVTSLVGADLNGFVVSWSEPADAHPCAGLRARTLEAADALRKHIPSFALTTPLAEAVPAMGRLDDAQAGLLYAHLRSRELCLAAVEMLTAEYFEKDSLGELLDEDHALHRDYLGVSSDQDEAVIAASKQAGALGARALGLGGAAVLAYAPNQEDEVVEAVRAHGWQARAVSPTDGARLDAGAVAPPWA